MDRVYFFDGQSLGAEDLNDGVNRLAENIKQRTVDFFSGGVVGKRTESFVQNDVNSKIKILPFVAYTKDGERIYMYTTISGLALDISSSTTDPLQKYRLRQQGDLADEDFGWLLNETYYIYVNYIEKYGKPVEQKSTGKFYPSRVYSGFEFYAIPQSDPNVGIDTTNMVRLCSLTYDGSLLSVLSSGFLKFASVDADKIYTSENASKTSSYNPRVPVSMEAHIMCLGSGTPTPTNPHGYTPEDLGFDTVSVQTHETRMHSAGISGTLAARNSVSSAFYTLPNYRGGTYDNLILYNLAADEYLHSNGFWLKSLAVTNATKVFLQFTYENGEDINPFPAGSYTIGIEAESGAIFVGSSLSNASNYTMNVTTDSSGSNVIQKITLMTIADYSSLNLFSIAKFEWDPTLPKPITNIIGFTNSNFVTKTDLRVFGGTNSLDLTTNKQANNTDILNLPYTVSVNKLVLSSGVEITGASVLPYGFMQGFSLSYVSQNKVTVNPGICRDVTNIMDISLTTPITKVIDVAWEPGGYTGTPVGGLSNKNSTMEAPVLSADHTGLHIFVIKNTAGDVDVAIDTDVTGANIRTGTNTQYYPYIRRVGSLYLSHLFSSGIITQPYVTVPEGSGLWVFYTAQFELPQSIYTSTTNQWLKAGVPAGSSASQVFFKGHYNAYAITTTQAFYSNYVVGKTFVSGTAPFDVYMADQALRTDATFPFGAEKVYCLGYYDARTNG